MKTLKVILVIALVLVTALYGFSSIYQNISGNDVAPQIQCGQDLLEISVQDPETVLLQGLTASDEQDGDLTDQIMVSGISKLISADTAKVTYLVFDSDDNMASYTRRVRYTDYRRPTLEITEPLVFSAKDTSLVIENLRATDVIDGDISDSIRISTLSTTEDSNVYSVTAQVTNSMGDTTQIALPVIVESTDPTRPVISLTEQLVYLEEGQSFNAQNYLLSLSTSSGRIATTEVSAEHQVDTGTPGTYWVYYRYSSGTAAALSILTVVVQ